MLAIGRVARCGADLAAPVLAAGTRPLRPLPPRGAGWRARGSWPPGSGDGLPASSGRELALLGPAGHGRGRHVQHVGHLAGPQVAGAPGCGLAAALGCHRASFLAPGPRQSYRSPEWTGCSSTTTARTCGGDGRVGHCWMQDEQHDYPTVQAPTKPTAPLKRQQPGAHHPAPHRATDPSTRHNG